MPTDKAIIYAAGAFFVVLCALAAMAALHERHYRDRRGTITEARYRGLEGRLAAVETILAEDRLT